MLEGDSAMEKKLKQMENSRVPMFNSVVRENLTEKQAFEHGHEGSEGRIFHGEATASTKVLRQEGAQCSQGTARRQMCPEWSEQGGDMRE